MNQINAPVNVLGHPACEKGFTPRQGQYLAFIHAYTQINRWAPAEADMQRYFQVTSPTVHQMVMMLERAGFIEKQPGIARSIKLQIDPEKLPVLKRD
ncbi:MAG: LexA family protein [Paracoccaceae bacterium]